MNFIYDNYLQLDIPKVVNDKTHKETTNGANKIIKDILCNISDVEENRQFRKEYVMISIGYENKDITNSDMQMFTSLTPFPSLSICMHFLADLKR